jgi:hypothetical protein
MACPNSDCDSPIMEERYNKKSGAFLQCPKCKHKVTETSPEAEST